MVAADECPARHSVFCVFALGDLPGRFLLTDVSSTGNCRRRRSLRSEESVPIWESDVSPNEVTSMRKTVIVTGGSKGIGAGLVKAFLDRGYNVVANVWKSPSRTRSKRQIDLRWSMEALPKRPPPRRSAMSRRTDLTPLMRWSTMPASISRNTLRTTRLTIFVLSHRSTSKVFS